MKKLMEIPGVKEILEELDKKEEQIFQEYGECEKASRMAEQLTSEYTKKVGMACKKYFDEHPDEAEEYKKVKDEK